MSIVLSVTIGTSKMARNPIKRPNNFPVHQLKGIIGKECVQTL